MPFQSIWMTEPRLVAAREPIWALESSSDPQKGQILRFLHVLRLPWLSTLLDHRTEEIFETLYCSGFRKSAVYRQCLCIAIRWFA